MNAILLQEKIDRLLNSVRLLLPNGSNRGYVYSDDLAQLNKSIHDLINELYSQRCETVEQEAALCLAILMGYSVSMYANSEDEVQKQSILERAKKLLRVLSPSLLKKQLFTIYFELYYSPKFY